MGDPWQRWLTISTRQTRGFLLRRYISNDLLYIFSFFTMHYTCLEQPPTLCCILSDTALLPPMTKHYVNRKVLIYFGYTAQFLFCCNLLFSFWVTTVRTLTPVFRHVICADTSRRVMLQKRSERCLHEVEGLRLLSGGSFFLSLPAIFNKRHYCVRSTQRGALHEINVDTLVSTLTRRGHH